MFFLRIVPAPPCMTRTYLSCCCCFSSPSSTHHHHHVPPLAFSEEKSATEKFPLPSSEPGISYTLMAFPPASFSKGWSSPHSSGALPASVSRKSALLAPKTFAFPYRSMHTAVPSSIAINRRKVFQCASI